MYPTNNVAPQRVIWPSVARHLGQRTVPLANRPGKGAAGVAPPSRVGESSYQNRVSFPSCAEWRSQGIRDIEAVQLGRNK